MQESLLGVMEYGFKVMKLKKLEAYTEKDNVQSIKLLERCNFAMKKHVDEQGRFYNKVFYMLVYAYVKRE
ncbi:MAG: GCN5-related N-acetyltransferase [Clostridiaceae bacterium]|jgi:ribosomal-protein-alanine N-acetyltransferase|nr:GCN5-related N-acetyltransferase [Clostridiaceae bacterium]